MRILVTGGLGFIGSNFVRFLLEEAPADAVERVVNLDKVTYAGNPENLSGLEGSPRYRFVRGDIGDGPAVAALLREHKIDTVANFAAESHVDRSIDSPGAFVDTNVVGAFRLLEEARHYAAKAKKAPEGFRFLHVSTDEVFGSLRPEDPAFSETTPYAPNSPYAASKASADHLVRAYHHTYGLPTLTTNCSNNYGPRQFPEKLIPLMIQNALALKPLPVYGDGKNVRDWLYVDDHCRGIWEVLRRGKPGETYNIGGRNEVPNIEIVRLLCARLDALRPRADGRKYGELIAFVADRPGHDRRYAIDCRKIEAELGWTPRETFATGLEKTIAWYLDNATWCEHIAHNTYRQERLGLGA